VELQSEEDTERKVLVFESFLKVLLTLYPTYGSVICEAKETTTGGMLSVKIVCTNNHQPQIKSIAILFHGNSFSSIGK